MSAKTLLKAGLRRSIGSGDTTFLWKDPWLPATIPRPPNDCGVYKDPLLLVSHLLDPVSKEWRLDRMEEIMDPADIELARSIKPSRSHRPDGYVWTLTKSGIYSVKSGYELASELRESDSPQQLVQPSADALKRQIWAQNTTKKLKHFMWNAVAGCTPVCSRLADRHCGTDRSCPRCGADEETTNHLIFECPPAKQVWLLSNIPISPGIFPCDALLPNFDFLLWRAKEAGALNKIVASVPWIIWYIWKARNEKVFKGNVVAPIDSLQMAMSEADAWFVAQAVSEDLDKDPPPADTNNQNPTDIHPRCQVDASWVHNSSFFGGGLVLDIDEDTTITGSFASTQVLSPLHAEFHSLIWAMKTVGRLGYPSVRFESDCQQLIKIIEEEEEWPSLASELEDFCFIRSSFSSFSLVFLPRSDNVRADSLSKEARARGFVFSHVNMRPLNGIAPRASPLEPS